MKRAILAVLVAAFVAGAVWAYATGRVTSSAVEQWLAALGPLGPAVFVGAFVAGAMIGLPGMVFVVGARLAFGAEAGFALGYGAGLLACIVPFATARRLRRGAAPVWQPRGRFARRAFDLVDEHPRRAVAMLRLVLWFSPPLSYALALTRVSLRDYIVGCAVALLPVVLAAVVATGWFV